MFFKDLLPQKLEDLFYQIILSLGGKAPLLCFFFIILQKVKVEPNGFCNQTSKIHNQYDEEFIF